MIWKDLIEIHFFLEVAEYFLMTRKDIGSESEEDITYYLILKYI